MRKKIGLSIVGMVLIAIVGLTGCGTQKAAVEQEKVKVARGDIVQSVNADGELSLLQQRKLTFGVDGKIDVVNVEEGARVTKGQLLAKLDTTSLDRAVKAAELAVKADELAEKFAALEEASPDLFHYFEGLLEAADKQAVQSGLFAQVASSRREMSAETFEGLTEKVLTDKFAGDRTKYELAMKEAANLRPDLQTAYIGAATAE